MLGKWCHGFTHRLAIWLDHAEKVTALMTQVLLNVCRWSAELHLLVQTVVSDCSRLWARVALTGDEQLPSRCRANWITSSRWPFSFCSFCGTKTRFTELPWKEGDFTASAREAVALAFQGKLCHCVNKSAYDSHCTPGNDYALIILLLLGVPQWGMN